MISLLLFFICCFVLILCIFGLLVLTLFFFSLVLFILAVCSSLVLLSLLLWLCLSKHFVQMLHNVCVCVCVRAGSVCVCLCERKAHQPINRKRRLSNFPELEICHPEEKRILVLVDPTRLCLSAVFQLVSRLWPLGEQTQAPLCWPLSSPLRGLSGGLWDYKWAQITTNNGSGVSTNARRQTQNCRWTWLEATQIKQMIKLILHLWKTKGAFMVRLVCCIISVIYSRIIDFVSQLNTITSHSSFMSRTVKTDHRPVSRDSLCVSIKTHKV